MAVTVVPEGAKDHMKSAGFDSAATIFYNDVDQMLSNANVDRVVIVIVC